MTAHPDPAALLRSRSYLGLLVIAALLGVPISATAYGFLALVSYLSSELFTHLPHGLGYTSAPVWWPPPVLLVGAALVAVFIRTLPGGGGPSPAGGFKLHKAPNAAQLPGLVAAALATLCFGMVLGPELPLIGLDHAASYSTGALVLLLACKGLAYGISLGCFRGGPIFPAMFMGAVGGIAMSHLPGLPLAAGIAMGIGAMSAVMLKLPLTSVLLATVLLGSDGLAAMPLAIVAVIVAHVASAWIAAPAEPAEHAGEGSTEPAAAGPPVAGQE